MLAKIAGFQVALFGYNRYLVPVLDLVLRLWVAKVFFMSGLTKVGSWSTTMMLFEYEYEVPILPFDVAAYLATAGELILPVLLVLGLFSRLGALGLFILNAAAAISYPDISPAGTQQHIMWGVMLVVLFVYEPSRLSIDNWLQRRYQ